MLRGVVKIIQPDQVYRKAIQPTLTYKFQTEKQSNLLRQHDVHLTPRQPHHPPLHHNHDPRPLHQPCNQHHHNYKLPPPYPPPLQYMPNLAPAHQVAVPSGPIPILRPLPRQNLAPNSSRLHVQPSRRTRQPHRMDSIYHLGQQRQQCC